MDYPTDTRFEQSHRLCLEEEVAGINGSAQTEKRLDPDKLDGLRGIAASHGVIVAKEVTSCNQTHFTPFQIV